MKGMLIGRTRDKEGKAITNKRERKRRKKNSTRSRRKLLITTITTANRKKNLKRETFLDYHDNRLNIRINLQQIS
jgi:hypothetical protein